MYPIVRHKLVLYISECYCDILLSSSDWIEIAADGQTEPASAGAIRTYTGVARILSCGNRSILENGFREKMRIQVGLRENEESVYSMMDTKEMRGGDM